MLFFPPTVLLMLLASLTVFPLLSFFFFFSYPRTHVYDYLPPMLYDSLHTHRRNWTCHAAEIGYNSSSECSKGCEPPPPPTPPGPPTGLYRCVDNSCVEVGPHVPGIYLKTCTSICGPLANSYECTKGKCTPTSNPGGLNLTQCSQFCHSRQEEKSEWSFLDYFTL